MEADRENSMRVWAPFKSALWCESTSLVLKLTNNSSYHTGYYCLSSRAASFKGHRSESRLSRVIISNASPTSRLFTITDISAESDARKSEMQARKGNEPQSRPATIYRHKMSLGEWGNVNFLFIPLKSDYLGSKPTRWLPELVFHNGKGRQRLKFPRVCYQDSSKQTARRPNNGALRNSFVMLPCFGALAKSLWHFHAWECCQMSIRAHDNEPQQQWQHDNQPARTTSKRHSNVTSVLDLHFDIASTSVARDAFLNRDTAVQPKCLRVNRLTSQTAPAAGGDGKFRSDKLAPSDL